MDIILGIFQKNPDSEFSVKKLSEICGRSTASVRRAANNLVARGLLRRPDFDQGYPKVVVYQLIALDK